MGNIDDSERDRLVAGITVDFENEVAPALDFYPCGFGSLGLDNDSAPTLGYHGPSLGLRSHFGLSSLREGLLRTPAV